MTQAFTIGIAGGTGSGKTTVTKKLLGEFGDQLTVIYHDDYYKAHDELTYEERCKINYDEPDAFDTQLMLEQLKQLKSGKEISCPVYDFAIYNRTAQTKVIEPAPVIIVEGILLLAIPELVEQLDMKVFVDTDADVRIIRRILRDVKERERSLDSIVGQYLTTVKPMHEKYVDPSKNMADIIIPRGGYNTIAMEMLIQMVRKKLGEYHG